VFKGGEEKGQGRGKGREKRLKGRVALRRGAGIKDLCTAGEAKHET